MLFSSFIFYIDPGTGSLLLQIVAGGIIASAMFFKRIWHSVFSFGKGKKNAKLEEQDD